MPVYKLCWYARKGNSLSGLRSTRPFTQHGRNADAVCAKPLMPRAQEVAPPPAPPLRAVRGPHVALLDGVRARVVRPDDWLCGGLVRLCNAARPGRSLPHKVTKPSTPNPTLSAKEWEGAPAIANAALLVYYKAPRLLPACAGPFSHSFASVVSYPSKCRWPLPSQFCGIRCGRLRPRPLPTPRPAGLRLHCAQ